MNPDVQIVLAYYSHYVMLPGYTPQSAMAAAFGRVASILPRRRGGIAAAVHLAAQRGEGVARAIEALESQGSTATLRSTLGNYPPPAATVQVRVLFTDSRGNVKTKLINASWDDTALSVEQRARDWLMSEYGTGSQWAGAAFSVRGPTLLPSQQEQ